MESVNAHFSARDRFPLILASGCVFVGGLITAYLLFSHRTSFVPGNFLPLFGTASTVILLGLCGLYIYAYVFYGDNFYQLLAVGWFANAIYIFFETFFHPEQNDIFSFSLKVYIVGIITSFPFYIASFLSVDNPVVYRNLFMSSLYWVIYLIISTLLLYGIAKYYGSSIADVWVGTNKLVDADKLANKVTEYKLMIVSIGGIPFSMLALFRVAKCLKTRLNPDIHGDWYRIFPFTFLAYACLQPFYLFRPFESLKGLTYFVFALALLTKIVNSICALRIMRQDVAELHRQLEQRSVLEDLGALTASIEHDIKNPLQVVDTELTRMREKFQANSEILPYIQRLQEQKARIFAATQIIPILRGKKDFYERFMVKINISDLINRSIKAVKKELPASNIIIKLDTKAIYVKAYPALLEQAIVNILRNAIEAIQEANRDKGIILITLKIENALNKIRNVRVNFEDNGSGISEKYIPEITKLFKTTRSSRKANSGVGLYISDRIMRIHAGNLLFKSTEGEGTTVSMIIPEWDAVTKKK